MKTVIQQNLVASTVVFLIQLFQFTISWEVSDHSSDCELVLVQLVFRHGDRNPINPYPTDPYKNESYWPEGYGQLTKVGKMQQYELGKFLRERYDGFVGPDYSPYEILVQSSNVDRAIASAEANLAGLYPPHFNRSKWNAHLEWQPIPVHSLPESIDNIINSKADCPRYSQLYEDFVNNSEIMRQINQENYDIYQLLTNHSGMNISNPRDVDYLIDDLFIERNNNFTLPDWAENVYTKYESKLHYLVTFSFRMLSYTKEMQKLRGGPLVKELIAHMNGKIDKSMDERRKIFMYSGHDTTVATLLNTLDLFNNQPPPYFSMVMVELHRNISSNEYFVEILFRNSTHGPLHKLVLPGCEYQCKMSQFLELTKSKVPVDWNSECKLKSSIDYDTVGLLVGVLVGFLVVGLLVGLGMIITSYTRNKQGGYGPKPPAYPYLHLQMEDGDDEQEA